MIKILRMLRRAACWTATWTLVFAAAAVVIGVPGLIIGDHVRAFFREREPPNKILVVVIAEMVTETNGRGLAEIKPPVEAYRSGTQPTWLVWGYTSEKLFVFAGPTWGGPSIKLERAQAVCHYDNDPEAEPCTYLFGFDTDVGKDATLIGTAHIL